MTQLDLISFFPAVFFSFEFFIFCLFFVSSILLFCYLSYQHFFINKVHVSNSHVYKLNLLWKKITKI